MKSIEEIRNEIKFAIENNKIEGYIENDYLYIPCFTEYSPIAILLGLSIFFTIVLFIIIDYLKLEEVYYYLIALCPLIIAVILYVFRKEFLVYDYNKGLIFFITKINTATISRFNNIDLRGIREIGITNSYLLQTKKRKITELFKRESESDILRNDFISNMVYINSEGKLKHLSAYTYRPNNKIDYIENLTKFCSLFSELTDIPCKICQNNQKLELINNTDTNNITFNIVPINIANEKSDRFKFNVKIFIGRFLLVTIVPMELLFISEFGFLGSFKAWVDMFTSLYLIIIGEK